MTKKQMREEYWRKRAELLRKLKRMENREDEQERSAEEVWEELQQENEGRLILKGRTL